MLFIGHVHVGSAERNQWCFYVWLLIFPYLLQRESETRKLTATQVAWSITTDAGKMFATAFKQI